jgi:hypothetical protein
MMMMIMLAVWLFTFHQHNPLFVKCSATVHTLLEHRKYYVVSPLFGAQQQDELQLHAGFAIQTLDM